ncbi:DUF975 family protein [Bifidobacterium breve]|uniref:DUF975 family protein n=1 Tax=Bifidobacterium breve TaxID=1685 RepID=UPI0026483658|nr:DUF975 family protein [Bifidobacterium breve]MDO8168899.1 DUF975 family protein [Bifidobacterium breve]
MEIASGQGSGARDQVNSNEKAIAALGRSRGVLSAALNSFSSGSFILSVADAATSVIHAQNVVISILVIVALLGTVAFPLFVVQVFRVVLRRIMLEARIYEKMPLRRFLYPLQSKRWVRMAWTMMVENAYLMLWWLTFVGGIIKTYSYFLVPYIVAENPNISANQAISLSRHMMKGHKWECFVAQVSFLGWYLLDGATVGLSGIFYSNGYNAAFFAEYYAYLRAVAKENGIEGAES